MRDDTCRFGVKSCNNNNVKYFFSCAVQESLLFVDRIVVVVHVVFTRYQEGRVAVQPRFAHDSFDMDPTPTVGTDVDWLSHRLVAIDFDTVVHL